MKAGVPYLWMTMSNPIELKTSGTQMHWILNNPDIYDFTRNLPNPK